jgi:hypothetical protein
LARHLVGGDVAGNNVNVAKATLTAGAVPATRGFVAGVPCLAGVRPPLKASTLPSQPVGIEQFKISWLIPLASE